MKNHFDLSMFSCSKDSSDYSKIFHTSVKKNISRIIIPVLASGSVFLAGCGRAEDTPMITVESGDNEINYSFVTCTRDDVKLTKKIRCTYKKNSEQEIYFPVSGKLVDKVYVKKGDIVHKGDVLVELSTGSLESQISQLEYRIARNELLMGYIDDEETIDMQIIWLNYLYRSGMSDADAKMRDSSLDALYDRNDSKEENYSDTLEFDRLELAALKNELAQSRIYAEFDGTVFSIADNLEGSTSNIDEVVMTIVDNDEGYFETEAGEYAQYFTDGETVTMTISAGNGKGTYELMPSDMENWGDTQAFTIFSSDNSGSIEAGTGGNISLVLESRSDVLCLPSSCVHVADNEYYVYVLNDDGLREVRWVEIGLAGDSKTEILSGITEGEQVIKR